MKNHDARREQKTEEEKAEILEASVGFFRWFVTSGQQGNMTFPCYHGIVGKPKVEVYVEPLELKNVFNMGAKGNE